MKRFNSRAFIAFCVICFVFGVGTDGVAAETGSGWRSTYDLILRWINFGILVLLILKVAKTPLKNFLAGQKNKLAQELERRKEEKEAATQEVEEILDSLKAAETRFSNIKDRILQQGEKRKKQIIDDASGQSRQIIEDAKRRVGGQILQAKQQLKSELIESAVDLAAKRLPREITKEDAQKFVDRFIAGTISK